MSTITLNRSSVSSSVRRSPVRSRAAVPRPVAVLPVGVVPTGVDAIVAGVVAGPVLDGRSVAHRRTGDTSAPVGATVRLRITARGRMVLTALAALPLLVVITLGVLNGGQASAGNTVAVHQDTVTVQPGETLWQLAGEAAPNADPRDFVQDVVDLNALDSSALQAGQQLVIPAKYTDAR